MKLLYSTDLHGDKNKYEKILELAIADNIKVIANGGDMLPKLGNRHKEQPIFINEYLRDYFRRLQEHDIVHLATLGNDDLIFLNELFSDVCNEFSNVHNLAGKKVDVNGYEFIGMNNVLDHPFGGKDWVVMEKNYVHQQQLSRVVGISNEFGYDEIYNWFEYAATELPQMCDILNSLPKPVHPDKSIYIMHMPPAGLKLGQLLYQDLDIGSVDIFEFIKEVQPLLTLHGHIHESPDTQKGKWINQILSTACIQTGQTELNDKMFTYAEIDLDNKNYERKQVKITK